MIRASRIVASFLVTSSLLLSGVPSHATPPDDPDREPEAIEIMQRADAALAAVTALEFDFEMTGTYGAAGRTTGHAVVERSDSWTNLRYLASIDVHVAPSTMTGFGSDVQIASDGEKIWLLDHEERLLVVGSTGGGAEDLQMPLAQFIMPLMFRSLQGVEIDLPERMSVAGVAEVGGVETDVVYLDFPDDGPYGEQYFYVGREDHLPRRITLVTDGGGSVTQFDFVMTHLEAIEPMDDEFRLEAPAGYTVDADALEVAPGALAGGWELTTPEGETVRLEELRGKVVVLDFWASWCPICRNQLPMASRVAEDLENLPVEFYGVNIMENGDPLAFLEEIGSTIPVFLEGGDPLAERYRVDGTGTIVIIDPEGRFQPRMYGNATRETLTAAIRSLLPTTDSSTESSAPGEKPTPR